MNKERARLTVLKVIGIVVSAPLWYFLLFGMPAEVYALRLRDYKTETYRGVTLYYHEGELSEQRLNVIYTVIDSLHDDVVDEYSMNNFSVHVFFETDEDEYVGRYNKNHPGSIFLSQHIRELDDGYFAMVLVHEYIHLVQFQGKKSFLSNYCRDTGWDEKDLSEYREDWSSHGVMSDYSLVDCHEDQAETYHFAYLCGNNLELLSDVRESYALSFWKVPREEFCQNFPNN